MQAGQLEILTLDKQYRSAGAADLQYPSLHSPCVGYSDGQGQHPNVVNGLEKGTEEPPPEQEGSPALQENIHSR